MREPFYKGDGNHSVDELQQLCRDFKEFCHQKQLKIQDLEIALRKEEKRSEILLSQRNKYIHTTDFRKEFGDLNSEYTWPEILECNKEIESELEKVK